MIGWLLYAFACAIVVGIRVSTSFACFVLLLAGAYVARRWWRGVTRPTIRVAGRDVPALELPRAVALPTSWRKKHPDAFGN